MSALALWILLPLGQAQTPPPAKPASAEVVVSDRPIQIPALPQSVELAHGGHRAIKSQLLQTRKDLEDHLRVLHRTLEGQSCPTTIKVPKNGGGDLRYLLSVLNDVRYQTMEERFLQTWDAWQASLVTKGLATPTESSGQTEAASALPADPTRSRPGVDPHTGTPSDFGSNKLDPFCRLAATRSAPGGKEVVDWEAYARLLEQKEHYVDRVYTAKQIKAVADKMAPDLATAWSPLVEHLNACARKLADLEQLAQGETPDQRLVRLYAHQAFLERVRLATWLCGVVWAEMTSDSLPPPLKPLY